MTKEDRALRKNKSGLGRAFSARIRRIFKRSTAESAKTESVESSESRSETSKETGPDVDSKQSSGVGRNTRVSKVTAGEVGLVVESLCVPVPEPPTTHDSEHVGSSGGGGATYNGYEGHTHADGGYGGGYGGYSYGGHDHHDYGGGGCFAGSSCVAMADGSQRQVQDLQKGDVVYSGEGLKGAEVICVVVMHIETPRKRMVILRSGLQVTPWHPIQHPESHSWVFPHDLGASIAESQDLEIPRVYNILLADGSSRALIDGIKCVTLGHGLTGSVVEHAFWGNRQEIIRSLRAIDKESFEKGRVEVGGTLRDASGQVAGYKRVHNM